MSLRSKPDGLDALRHLRGAERLRKLIYNHATGNVEYSRHQWGWGGRYFIDESLKVA